MRNSNFEFLISVVFVIVRLPHEVPYLWLPDFTWFELFSSGSYDWNWPKNFSFVCITKCRLFLSHWSIINEITVGLADKFERNCEGSTVLTVNARETNINMKMYPMISKILNQKGFFCNMCHFYTILILTNHCATIDGFGHILHATEVELGIFCLSCTNRAKSCFCSSTGSNFTSLSILFNFSCQTQ